MHGPLNMKIGFCEGMFDMVVEFRMVRWHVGSSEELGRAATSFSFPPSATQKMLGLVGDPMESWVESKL